MITIIAGTNRKGSATETFAKQFHKIFKSKTKEKIKYISLQKLPKDVLHNMMYNPKRHSKGLKKMQEESLMISDKFFIVSPEYNGSIPGVLKLFIDACSIYEYATTFKGKKAGLVGVASGRAGNLRGMDHLTGILNHVGTQVMPSKLPISSIGDVTNDKGEITNKGTLEAMEKHVDAFLKF